MSGRRRRVKVVLELDGGGDRIAGVLDGGDGPPRHFDGWLELSALLDQFRRPPAGSGEAGDAPPAASATRR